MSNTLRAFYIHKSDCSACRSARGPEVAHNVLLAYDGIHMLEVIYSVNVTKRQAFTLLRKKDKKSNLVSRTFTKRILLRDIKETYE